MRALPITTDEVRAYVHERTVRALERKPNLQPLRYHPTQYQLMQSRSRFQVAACGRRSGKTELAKRHLLRAVMSAQATEYGEPRRYFYGAPTRAQAKEIAWNWFKRNIPDYYIEEKSESELWIRLNTGAEIHVRGLEVGARIEGTPWDGCVLDEFADMRAAVWPEHVRPALSTPGRPGWCWFVGTPAGRNHFYDVHSRASALDGWQAFHWISADIMEPEEIAAAKADLDPRAFRQEFEASFEEAQGRIYYAFDPRIDVHEFDLVDGVGKARPWYGGMDFNVNPMTACWGWETEEEDGSTGKLVTHVWIWDEAWIRTANTHDVCTHIKRRCGEWSEFGTFVLHPDPTGRRRNTATDDVGQTDFTMLRDSGFLVRARNASPKRRDRMNSVNSMFCSGAGARRIHIHPRCRKLVWSLDGISYRDGTNMPDLNKCRDMDHITDALGYWIEYRHRPEHLGPHPEGVNF